MQEQYAWSSCELQVAHANYPKAQKPQTMKTHPTREAWLLAAIECLRTVFAAKGYGLPQCQVSCGFSSTGVRNGHIGQCWSTKSSANGLNHIFISPTLATAYEVIDTLVHELVHAVDNCEHKHGREFKKIALKLGMVGPMRSAGAGPELRRTLEGLLTTLGPYPHGQLKVSMHKASRRNRPRAKCKHCGYQVPMLKKYLAYGPPICPQDKVEMEALGDWEDC
jgi:hypothetical protein